MKRRDADLTYNLRTFADLPAEAPGFDWAGWVAGAGQPHRSRRRTRRAPTRFLTAFAALWSGEGLDDWKSWLRWRLITAARRC